MTIDTLMRNLQGSSTLLEMIQQHAKDGADDTDEAE
jgi:hypothetical protein